MMKHVRDRPRWRGLLLALVLMLLAGCGRDVLYAHLDEQQANEVVAALLNGGVDAEKRPAERGDDWQVLLDRRDLPAAVGLLRDAGLPRQSTANVGQLFKKDGFVSSPTEDKARYIFAKEQELDNTLRKIDGVVDAEVHLAIPDKDPISDKPPLGSASVVIIARPNAGVESHDAEIKSVVKNGVEGLDDAARVTVQFFSRMPMEPPATNLPAASHASVFAGGMRGDVGSLILIAFAVLIVVLAAALLWRNRQSLTGRSRGGS
jgi:type III secretion protein J